MQTHQPSRVPVRLKVVTFFLDLLQQISVKLASFLRLHCGRQVGLKPGSQYDAMGAMRGVKRIRIYVRID